MLEEFIVPSVSHTNPKIRETAVKALGCACLRSLRAAKQLLLLVLQVQRFNENPLLFKMSETIFKPHFHKKGDVLANNIFEINSNFFNFCIRWPIWMKSM